MTASYWFRQLEPYYHRPLSQDLYAFFHLLWATSGMDVRAFVRRFIDHDPDGLLCEWLLDKGQAVDLIDEFNLDATAAIQTCVVDPLGTANALLSYYKDKPDKADQYERYCQAVVRSFQKRWDGRDVLCELRDAGALPAELINIRVTRSVANRVKK